MMTKTVGTILIGLVLGASAAFADRIELADGSVIMGKKLLVEAGKFKIDTSFAGTLEIAQDKVKSFSTDEPVNILLTGGTPVLSEVQSAEGGIKIKMASSPDLVATGKIYEIWRKDSDSPEIRKLKAIAAGRVHHWSYEAAAAIAGRTGVADKFSLDLGVKATLANDTDKLVLSGAVQKARDEGVDTASHLLGSADYSSYDSAGNGWYAKTLLEQDHINLLDLRSSTALGLGHKLIKNKKEDLEVRAGLVYLYEKYDDDTSFESPGLDIAVLHSYMFSTSKLTNMIDYTPAFKTFANYRIHHESAFEIPLAASMWKLKIGVANDYNSRPPDGVKRLDTTYFSSLLLTWK
ncbi:MAG TPA: DUF481 domain-containing protein [Candidatus Didemnitutus sp.]